MRKYLIILIVVLLFPFKIYASEQLSDGWHVVKNIEKTDDCKLNYVWAYYKNGVEKLRFCKLLQVHRAWGEAPENSLASIKMNREKGYYAYETDIHFTKDNIPVLIHNATINKMARNKDYTKLTKEIAVKETNLADIQKYIFVVTRKNVVLKDPKYANNTITTFKDALNYSKEAGMFIVIELKAGTASQIASLVKMVKDAKMENSVKYISFQPTLLSYVKDADPYAELGLLDTSYYTETGTCNPGDNRYCKSITEKGKDEGEEQRKKFHEMLENGTNFVRITGDPSPDKSGRGSFASANLPDDIENWPNTKYKIDKLISTPTLTLEKNKISIETGKSLSIKYTYNGDGTVKCATTNKSYVTCSVDKTNKVIKVNVIKAVSSDIKLNIYATQGVKYCATKDVVMTVTKFVPTPTPKVTATPKPTATPKVTATPKPTATPTPAPTATPSPIATPSITPTPIISTIKGDVDGNGKVGSSDYVLVRKHILKQLTLSDDRYTRADMNEDSKITSMDYVSIRKILMNN